MKKGQKRKLIVLLTIFMAGAVLNGCMLRVVKDTAMDLYEDKVKGGRADKEGADEDDGADTDTDMGGLEDGPDGASADGADGEEQEERTDSADTDAVGAGTYARYIKEELEPKYGAGDNTFFSYGFERTSYAGSDYWFASPMTAQLEDGIIATCQRDLDKDGFDELLMFYTEGSRGGGGGRNNLCVKVYTEKDGTVMEAGEMRFSDCFSGYNCEDYMIGLKDLGDKRLLYGGRSGGVYTWADGYSPEIHLYQYDGSSLREIYQVATSGSDDSWWDGWRNDLRRFGFDIVSERWDESDLTGESGFEVLVYGECDTIVNEKEMYSSGDSQQYILDHGRIEGGIYGPGSDIVKRMNQGMTAYAGGGYTGGGGVGLSGGPGSGGYSAAGGDYILPESGTRYLTRQDLAGLTKDQLRLARNEIYARHGRKFQTPEIQAYFNSKSWYVGTIEPKDFREEYLNAYEKENLKLIQSLED